MTELSIYDGSGRLTLAIAKLCEVSPKNSIQIAALIKEAKDALGIATKSKRLPSNVNRAIYQWHCDRLQAVEIVSQPTDSDTVELFSQAAQSETVEIISQPETVSAVEIVSQPAQSEVVELFSQPTGNEAVNIVSQPESVNIISQSDGNEAVEIISQYDINALVRIAFYTIKKGVRTRQVIALEGFMVNALMFATGNDKKYVSKWVQQAVNNWGAFDSALPITKQVKFLIIREITAQLVRLKNA